MDGFECPIGIDKLVNAGHDSKLITDATLTLQKAWPRIQDLYTEARPGCHLRPVFTYRTPEHQYKLFMEGRINTGTAERPVYEVVKPEEILTNADGYIKLGPHNYYPARAIDVVVINEHGQETWDDFYYVPLGTVAKKLDLIWGGNWATIKDTDHIEVPTYKVWKEPAI